MCKAVKGWVCSRFEWGILEDCTEARIISKDIIQLTCAFIMTFCYFMSHSILSIQCSKCPQRNIHNTINKLRHLFLAHGHQVKTWARRIKILNPDLLLTKSVPPEAPQWPRNGNKHLDHFPEGPHKGSLWHCTGQGLQGTIPQQEEGLTLAVPTQPVQIVCRSELFLLEAG